MQLSGIYEAEVLSISNWEDNDYINLYDIRLVMPDGGDVVLSNVPVASMFGGIGDYSNMICRPAFEDKTTVLENFTDPNNRLHSVGDRAIVSFLGMDMQRPVIIGFLPHPGRRGKKKDTVIDLPEPEYLNPQKTISYLGMKVDINTDGETTITHRGAPAVSFDGSLEPEPLAEDGPAEFPDRQAEEGKPLDPYEPVLPVKSQGLQDNEFPVLDLSDQLVFPDPKYTTQQGFLKRGEWYVCDSEKQQIFLDRDSKTITISNGNDIIQIDKENRKILIKSSGDIEKTVDGDEISHTVGSQHSTVETDMVTAVNGNTWRTVGGNITEDTKGNIAAVVKGTWDLQVQGEFFKVESASGNILYFDERKGNEGIFLIHKTQSQLSISPKGNILLLGSDGSNIAISAAQGNITVQSAKGGLVSINDKIVCSDASGKNMVSITDTSVEINSEKNVVVSADAVSINSGSVSLGAQAVMSSVVWENLQAWLDTHTHVCGTGIGSPPVIQTATLKGSPLDPGSKYVKLRPNI